MATYNQVIYNLKNLYYNGITTDDNNISNEQLLFIFNTYRSLFIYRELEKKRQLNSSFTQELGKVELVPIDITDQSDVNLQLGCKILRSVNKLPEDIVILSLTTFDGGTTIQLSQEATVRWSKYKKYSKYQPYAYIKNEYLYIVNMDCDLLYVKIRGIFQDPTSVDLFNNSCIDYDKNYPLDDRFIPTINDMIINKELKILANTRPDETNNFKEDNR